MADKQELNITKGNEHPEEWEQDLLLRPQEYNLAIIDYMRQKGEVTETAKLSDKEKFDIATKAQLTKALKGKEAEIEQAKREERERILYVVKDYFYLSFGEFASKYNINKGRLPGDEIWQALGEL